MSGLNLKKDEIQKQLAEKIKAANCFCLTNITARTGKIRMVLKYILTPEDSAVVIYPELDIRQSWVDDIKNWEFEGHIKFYTTRSVEKITETPDYLILDEYHAYSQNQILQLKKYVNKHHIRKIIGLSGSVSEETAAMWYEIFNLRVKVSYLIEEAVNDGVVTDYSILVKSVPLSDKKTIVSGKIGSIYYRSEKQVFDSISYSISLESNIVRLKMLRLQRMNLIKKSTAKLELTKKLLSDYKNERILVFTGLTEVADNLGIPSYHSKNNEKSIKDGFLKGKFNQLAIVNKLNTGITFPNLSKSIVNFFDSNPENMFQKINRITSLEYDNPSKKAEIIIISSNEEVEHKWLAKGLAFFDPNKITYE